MGVKEASASYFPKKDTACRSGCRQTEVGVIPDDWGVAALDSLGRRGRPAIKAGPFGSSLTKNIYVPEGYKIYGQEQVIRGDYLYGDYYITKSRFNELKSCAVEPGDILLSLVGTAGRVLVIPAGAPAGIINPRLIRFSFDLDLISPRYFQFLFETQGYQALLSRSAQGGTMGVLNAGLLRPICVPLPPVAEQEAIAEALSDADVLIESLEQLLGKKRRLKQGAIQELLTGRKRLPGFKGEWEVKRLGDLGSFLKGSGVRKDESFSGDLACIRYGEIYTIHNDYIKAFQSCISMEVAATARRLKQGDLLFAGSGETKEEIGKCVAFVDDMEAYAGGDIVILRPENSNSIFLGYYLNTAPINKQKASKGQGDAVVHISSAALSSIEIAIPKIDEQTAIATVLSDIDNDLAALEARLAKARAIKQGMMQELLTGRIRLV